MISMNILVEAAQMTELAANEATTQSITGFRPQMSEILDQIGAEAVLANR